MTQDEYGTEFCCIIYWSLRYWLSLIYLTQPSYHLLWLLHMSHNQGGLSVHVYHCQCLCPIQWDLHHETLILPEICWGWKQPHMSRGQNDPPTPAQTQSQLKNKWTPLNIVRHVSLCITIPVPLLYCILIYFPFTLLDKTTEDTFPQYMYK